jgi:hypothetical protein
MAEKVNKNERKNRAEIITEMPGDESSEFWKVLGDEEGMPPSDPIVVMIPHAGFLRIISNLDTVHMK